MTDAVPVVPADKPPSEPVVVEAAPTAGVATHSPSEMVDTSQPASPSGSAPAAHTVQLPPGRTIEEQLRINDQAIDACGLGEMECSVEMGYISVLPPRPSAEEAAMEGNIIAGIAVLLGLLWLGLKVWARLFAARTAYRYITEPRK